MLMLEQINNKTLLVDKTTYKCSYTYLVSLVFSHLVFLILLLVPATCIVLLHLALWQIGPVEYKNPLSAFLSVSAVDVSLGVAFLLLAPTTTEKFLNLLMTKVVNKYGKRIQG